MENPSVPQKPDDFEITIVKEIFSRLERGESSNSIAMDLNKRSIPAPLGGFWTSTAVSRIRDNPIYASIIVLGKTKHDYNPLIERHYDCPVPPEEWSWYEDPILHPYQVITPQKWIEIQMRSSKIASKSAGRGRPTAEFGPSILSGLLFCGYCGAPLVSGRGKNPRVFRCSRRRLKKGNPHRCEHTFSVHECQFVSILIRIINDVLSSLFDDCVRILNEEFKKAGKDIRNTLRKKEDEYRALMQRENTLLDFYNESKRRGMVETFDEYYSRISDVRKKIVSLERELKAYRDANAFAITPIALDEKVFSEKLNDLENLLLSDSDPTKVRTAIKCFIPRILIKSYDVDGRSRVFTFQIDQIPDGLPDFLKQDHTCIVELRKSKTNIRKELLSKDSTSQRINFFQSVYDNLSDRYLSDKLSYKVKSIVPRYWQVIIPLVGKRRNQLANRFFFSLPFGINLFGFDNAESELK